MAGSAQQKERWDRRAAGTSAGSGVTHLQLEARVIGVGGAVEEQLLGDLDHRDRLKVIEAQPRDDGPPPLENETAQVLGSSTHYAEKQSWNHPEAVIT